MRIGPDFLFSLSAVGVVLTMASDGAPAAYIPPSPVLIPAILLPATSKPTKPTCIILNGDEYCLVKKGVGGGMGGTGGGGMGGTGGGGMGGGGMGGGGMGGGQPGNTTGNGGENGTSQGGGTNQQNNPATNATTQTEPGEHTCPAGYVVLDKPNKYGAFCEPKEGFPGTPGNQGQ